MDQGQALRGFAALSQETRLAIVGLLVRAGPDGLAAGAVAAAVDASPSNVSFHLKDLEHAGLITARREARSIIYTASYDTLRDLIGFLMKDCCAGRPEICAPAAAACTPAKCTPARTRRRVPA
jgi:DNA-binding transcriptional ArsR family regulator